MPFMFLMAMMQPVTADQLIEWISQNRQEEIRSAVLANPALLKLRAKDGSSLVRQAMYRQRPDIAHLLVEAGAELDFYDACALGDFDTVMRFLSHDKSLANSFAEDGFPALGLAIFFGRRDVAIHLLASGTDVNSASRNQIRVTPLHSAVAAGDFLMTAILLSHGADPNAKEFLGGTPLHTAAAEGKLDIAQLLVRHGAACSVKTNAGETPLDLARKHKREETIAWLGAQEGCN